MADEAAMTPFQKMRLEYQPPLPTPLEKITQLEKIKASFPLKVDPKIQEQFPKTSTTDGFTFKLGQERTRKPHRVGVLFSGGQAAGGHNVICGLYDALKRLSPNSELIGFLDGPIGLIEGRTLVLTREILECYRNMGGFDLIASGRTKIETPEQFASSLKTVKNLTLDGVVIIGGDDSNTNAAYLAEYFQENGVDCTVTGVPKTIDADLKNEYIEISFGFDTAAKTYSNLISNISRDVLSSKKQWAFIKLMGRSASHITLECAMQTQPNMALIGEEVAAQNKSLQTIVREIANLVETRSQNGKNYGVILIPEGIVEFMPGFNELIAELNTLLANEKGPESLTGPSRELFDFLPPEIQKQFLMERDPHGNVQVSKIETERLLIALVKKELKKVPFSPQPFFLGYEGRSAYPSNFDATYCYALGHVAALCIEERAQGYMGTLQNLHLPAEEWQISLIPLTTMLTHEMRKGKEKAVIKKALVDLEGPFFKAYKDASSSWKLEDHYSFVGPIQFFGHSSLESGPVRA